MVSGKRGVEIGVGRGIKRGVVEGVVGWEGFGCSGLPKQSSDKFGFAVLI